MLEWIKNMACFICVFQILLHIVPGDNYRKYVRFIGGVLLILLVMSPLAEAAGWAEVFTSSWEMESLKSQIREIEASRSGLAELQSKKVEEAFQSELAEGLEALIQKNGYHLVSLDMQCESDVVYDITEMTIIITKKPNKISIQGEETSPEEGAGVKNLKNEICNVYQIPQEHINISIQE